MKKILKAAMMLMGAVALMMLPTACKKEAAKPQITADQSIARAVNGLSLPETLSEGVTLTDCTYADKTLTFRCSVDETVFKQLDQDASREKTLNQLKNGLFQEALVEKIKEANASIRYIVESGDSTIEFNYSARDLQ